MLSTSQLSNVIKKMQSGDEAALKTFYDSYYSHIWFICSKLCESAEDTEEVVQDTFLRAFKSSKALKDVNTASGWLRAIAIRECYRKNSKKPLNIQTLELSNEALEFIPDLNENFLPEIYMQKKEFRENIIKLIDALPKKQRDVTYLFYYADMKIDEIANIQKCSPESVKQALYLARNSIKGKVQDQKKTMPLYSVGFVPLALLLHTEAHSLEVVASLSAEKIFSQMHKKLHYAKVATYSVIGVAVTSLVAATVALSGVFVPKITPKMPIVKTIELVTKPTTTPMETAAHVKGNEVFQPIVEEERITETPEIKTRPVETIKPMENSPEPENTVEPVIEPIVSEDVQPVDTPTGTPTKEASEEPVAEPTVEAQTEAPQERDTVPEKEVKILQGDETQSEVNEIIIADGYVQLRLVTNKLGDEYRLYGLDKGDRRILIGTHINAQTGIWKVKQDFVDISTPIMSSMDLVDWLDRP